MSVTQIIPNIPPPGLLMSMALRYDHALGCPGYYDQEFIKVEGITHSQRLAGTLSIMRQLYDEVTGHGFYSPDKEENYASMMDSALKHET